MKSYVISDETIKKISIGDEKIQSSLHYFLIVNASDIEQISPKFNLTECNTSECLERRHYTGIETHKQNYFIGLNIPKINEGRISSQQIDVFFGKNFIIISLNEEVELINKIEDEIINKPDITFKGVSNPANKILYTLFDRLVLRSLWVVSELERKIEAQEERVLKIGRRNMVNELIALRRQVFKVRRYLSPLTYISDMLLLNELGIIDDHMIKYFSNIGIKFSQLNRDISSIHQSITSLREAYESEISNQLNEIMKVFTIISTIFLPLNLVTGIYGMNFTYMPELNTKFGYFVVLGFMACLASVLIVVFRRKKWL